MKKIPVKWLFVVDYYDGVITAVVLDENENYLFAVRELDEEGGYTNRFMLYEIPIHRLVEILGWHQLFQRYVGNNCDFIDNGRPASAVSGPPKRKIGDLQPYEKWSRFYDIYGTVPHGRCMNLDVRNQSPVGYCGK